MLWVGYLGGDAQREAMTLHKSHCYPYSGEQKGRARLVLSLLFLPKRAPTERFRHCHLLLIALGHMQKY